jgi:hypothetical protein
MLATFVTVAVAALAPHPFSLSHARHVAERHEYRYWNGGGLTARLSPKRCSRKALLAGHCIQITSHPCHWARRRVACPMAETGVWADASYGGHRVQVSPLEIDFTTYVTPKLRRAGS